MSKRKTITKSVRFEVFKRDQFKCQYCGVSAPDVLLHIDHINPVANGGTNEIINLITACFDCNNGKRDKLLSDHTAITKQKQQLEQLQERREQLEMMMQWHEGLKSLQEDLVAKLKDYWEALTPGYSLSENGEQSLKKLAKAYPVHEVLKAMDIAAEQYLSYEEGKITKESCETAYKKIPAIAKVSRDSIDNPDLKDFLYIRAIIRNRLHYYDPQKTLDWLKSARSWGVTIDELKRIASTTRNWTSFSDDIDEIIERYKDADKERSEPVDDLPF